jgi:signal transduction histidine kinase
LALTIKSGFDGRNPLAKTLILVIALSAATALCGAFALMGLMWGGSGDALIGGFFLVLVLAAALFFSILWVRRYEALKNGVEQIAGGNLHYQIPVKGNTKNEFDRLSAQINQIGAATEIAVQNELKTQRLKTELISNVSHDLKTPLTSVITYTDLLKKEGPRGKNAAQYIEIIEEKGKRLQKLTEDLFEAAKASSGAINVNKETVDLRALLDQEIAEMNGGFGENGLQLIISGDAEHYYVQADSRLLWRVVDNLLNNVRKYAAAGSRVYIDLKEAGQSSMVSMEIKNISASRLNIPADELMERFKRGDAARTEEGSGLGLAIARDLVRLQGGWFDVAIDGDLFKAIVTLPRS